jgi:proline dehydrogenase
VGPQTIKASVVARAGRRYLAGVDASGAQDTCDRIVARGYDLAITYWDAPSEPRDEVAARYAEALDLARRYGAPLAIKATSFGFSLDTIRAFADRDVRLHFDGMGQDDVDRTFELIGRLDGDLGTTLAGRWERSDRDADRAVEMGLAVRIVKGQFRGDEERDPAAGILAVVDRLVGRARHVGVATHDRALAAEALRRLREAGTPAELEQLYGIPPEPPPARIYVPYGHGLLPYALNQIRGNPRILWWLGRDLVLRRAT